MGDEIRINRSQPQQAPRQEFSTPTETVQAQRGSKAPWVILGVVVLVLLVAGVLFRDKLRPAMNNGAPAGQASGYQAIFLTNGQVYFGKISNPGSDYVTLKDIYYLQVGPQQGSGTNGQGQATDPQQSISLVKLGNELHGPVDEMHISRAQVLFYEDLKSEGSVVKAIEAYKANPSGAPAN